MESVEVSLEAKTAVVKGRGLDPAALVKAVEAARGGDFYRATAR